MLAFTGGNSFKILPELCIKADMPAVAADKNNLFCALEFSVSASRRCAADNWLSDRHSIYSSKSWRLLPKVTIILIAQSERGYQI